MPQCMVVCLKSSYIQYAAEPKGLPHMYTDQGYRKLGWSPYNHSMLQQDLCNWANIEYSLGSATSQAS